MSGVTKLLASIGGAVGYVQGANYEECQNLIERVEITAKSTVVGIAVGAAFPYLIIVRYIKNELQR